MSDQAVRWALSVTAPSPAAKLILWVLADMVRAPDFKAYPSAPTVAKCTGLDRKTVLRSLPLLEQAGLIRRLPEQAPHRGGGPVWRLAWSDSAAQGTGVDSGTGSEIGTASEPVPLLPGTSTTFPANPSHFSREPVPKTGHKPDRTNDEPEKNHGERARKGARVCPASFELTEELKRWAAATYPRVDVDRELCRFRVHEYRKPLTRWDLAFKAWIMKADQFAESNARRPQRRTQAEMTFAETDYSAGLAT